MTTSKQDPELEAGLETIQRADLAVPPAELASRPQEPQGVTDVKPAHAPTSSVGRWVRSYPVGFKGSLQATGKVASVLTIPWWWPVGYLARDLQKAPGRLKTAAVAPFQMWKNLAIVDQANWNKWTPAERFSVLRQAGVWILLFLGAAAALPILPAPWNLVPLGLAVCAWYMKWAWDPVRFLLGLRQLRPEDFTASAPVQAPEEACAEGREGFSLEEPHDHVSQEVLLEAHDLQPGPDRSRVAAAVPHGAGAESPAVQEGASGRS